MLLIIPFTEQSPYDYYLTGYSMKLPPATKGGIFG